MSLTVHLKQSHISNTNKLSVLQLKFDFNKKKFNQNLNDIIDRYVTMQF